MSELETIYALASGATKAGVAVIRISGKQALTIASLLTRKRVDTIKPRYAHYVNIKDITSGNNIDDGLMLFFKQPNSFTGEDVVEFHIHGSKAVVDTMYATIDRFANTRIAQAGEFTRRAFDNNKLDLTEAEGLSAILDAETTAQLELAHTAFYGKLRQKILAISDNIKRCLALTEACIDFADDEVPASTLLTAENLNSTSIAQIQALLDSYKYAKPCRHHFKVALVGKPNVGKSTIINAIAKKDVAIIHDQAGTTRDIIETIVDIAGLPICFVDTAGLRDSDDEVEQQGVIKAKHAMLEADLLLHIVDDPQSLDSVAHDQAIIAASTPKLLIANKSDIINYGEDQQGFDLIIAANNTADINSLITMIDAKIRANYLPTKGEIFLIEARHHQLLQLAMIELESIAKHMFLDQKCQHLRQAMYSIDEITGFNNVESLLDDIFASFCIGK
jgi:tRNA modification GTPase